MKNWLLTITIVACMLSCTKKDNTESLGVVSAEIAATPPVEKKFELETFDFPKDIQGCSCYFAANKADFEKEKYIFADDMGISTYIKIDGAVQKLKKTDDNMDPENFSKTIEDEKYLIKLNGKRLGNEEEILTFEGTMTVKDKTTGKETSSPIYGECGC